MPTVLVCTGKLLPTNVVNIGLGNDCAPMESIATPVGIGKVSSYSVNMT